MAGKPILDLDSFRKQGLLPRSAGRVPCAKCKALIAASTSQCPECGIHFDGAAEDFVDDRPVAWISPRRRWVKITALAILLLLLLSLMAQFI
jgi:predicted amidophosphoribosyltransferase